MVVVGYEDLVKADMESNFKKLDGKGKKKEPKPKKEVKVEKDLTEPTAKDIYDNNPNEDKTPEGGENEEPSTLF